MKLKKDTESLATQSSAEAEPLLDAEEKSRDLEEYFEQRRETLKDIPYKTVRKAWFTLSHLLLDDDSTVLFMGALEGTLVFCMAALAPNLHFIGIDRSKRNINKAREKYDLHNLEFLHADTADDLVGTVLKPQSVDGIINSFILHDIYSNSRYSEEIVSKTLENHFKILKPGGVMFIEDYPRLKPEEFILIEFSDIPSKSNAISDLSDPDLLVWYSQNARVGQDPTRGGFFIEELPPRRPKTRLFRLPFKWAYEFIVRTGRRERWDNELPTEYTFFTMREFRKELRTIGARVQYSGPRWNEEFIDEHFEGRFRLFDTDGKPLDTPPTSFIAVAYKMPQRKGLLIEERRPSDEEHDQLKIAAMRNEHTGALVDIVTPHETVSEILPYRISSKGRLKVYLHEGATRGITNSVARSGLNLDGKRWSGHLVEAIAVKASTLENQEDFNFKEIVKFSRDYLGLKPDPDAKIVLGPDYYPSPDFIDERIYTYYLNVQKHKGNAQPRKTLQSQAYFQTKSGYREFDAQKILDAIAVGMIPNSRLELQILSLYNALNLQAENWTVKDLIAPVGKVTSTFDSLNAMKKLSHSDHRFKEIKGTTGNLRAIKSIFVEEGQISGARAGLNAHDLDFVISEEKTINTAVALPLTSNVKKDMHAGILMDHLPVPQRFEGNGLTATVPSFNIPPHITDIKQMKKFVADKFGVMPDMVFKLGESYYTHIGISPQRIYPFGVAAPGLALDDPSSHFIPIQQFRALWKSLSKSTHFMTVLARSYKLLQNHIRWDYSKQSKPLRALAMDGKTPDWSIPTSYEPPPGKDAPGQHQQTKTEKTKNLEIKTERQATTTRENTSEAENTPVLKKRQTQSTKTDKPAGPGKRAFHVRKNEISPKTEKTKAVNDDSKTTTVSTKQKSTKPSSQKTDNKNNNEEPRPYKW